MCGINGVIWNPKSEDLLNVQETLTTMNKLIGHRGPDDDGFYTMQSPDYHIGMAMRRLAIIDIQGGSQPQFSANKKVVIVFNGEIYNHKALRLSLEKEGIIFQTQSDTEVILKLYEKKGTQAFAMLDGMFAFSIYDQSKNKIHIARDFFGEKPLYYTQTENTLVWASELKSIQALKINTNKISKKALNLLFQLSYIPAPHTIYKNIHKLESNHFITFCCKDFKLEINKVKHDKHEFKIENKKQAIQTTHDLVIESVLSRSISDVPVGTFLSGGVDSSIVSLCLAQQQTSKIDTFSIGFSKKAFDESEKARTVAKIINSNHHEFIMDAATIKADLNELLLNFDEPFADSSALATYFVSKKTSGQVKVALTGDGGDEVFGGYNKYLMGKINQNYTRLMPENIHKLAVKNFQRIFKEKNDLRGISYKMNRLLNAISYDDDFYFNIIRLGYQEQELQQILLPSYLQKSVLEEYKQNISTSINSLTDFRKVDYLISLEGDLLPKVDRTSMLNSLECRAPFLSRKLWDFSMQLPENYLLHRWDKKHILKEAFKNYFPKNFLNKSKQGFRVPVGDWLRKELKIELLGFIDKTFVEKQAIFNFNAVEKLVLQHIHQKADATFKVWIYYCFQKWYKAQLDT